MKQVITSIIGRHKTIKMAVLKLYLFFLKYNRTLHAKKAFGIFNIELTNKCIMKCIMCPRTYGMSREQGFMDFDVYKKIIDELITANPTFAMNKGVWLHHFGESLLHKEVDMFISYAAGKNVRAQLSLNPLALTKEMSLKLIKANPNSLHFSIDGHDDSSFKSIRGVNGYNESIDNIFRFLEFKKIMNSKIIIVLSIIDFAQNEQSINTFKNYWENMDGVDKVLIKSFVYWDGNTEEINLMKTKTKKLSINNMAACNKPWETMTVLWDGTVVPCCFDYNGRYALGNIKNHSLSEMWNNEKMTALRKEFINNRVSNQLCRKCRQLKEMNL